MAKITVWKCDTTGGIFEDYTKYRKHLRAMVELRRVERARAQAQATWDSFIAGLAERVSTFDELAAEIRANWDQFHYNAVRRDVKAREPVELVSLKFGNMRWSELCSNSHSAPLNGERNWWRNPELTTGYPGWTGEIYFEVREIKKGKRVISTCQGSSYFDNSRINTGSGGGTLDNGIAKSNYGVTLYASDWPGLTKNRELCIFMGMLKKDYAG